MRILQMTALFIIFILAAMVGACSKYNDISDVGNGGSGGGGAQQDASYPKILSVDGGTGGTGGSGGSGGIGGTGGIAHIDSGSPAPTCETVKNKHLDLDALYPKCPAEICADGGHCMKIDLVPESGRSQLAACDKTTLCVPDNFIQYDFLYTLRTCRSVGDAEGRCVSTCLPASATSAINYTKSSCDENELCVSCYDLKTGEDTGACRSACDRGGDNLKTFADCCSGLGKCIPPEAAGSGADQLSQDTCDTGLICAPADITLGNIPAACTSLCGAEGRCLPACLPSIASQGDNLSQDTCDDGNKCVPCYDPRTGDDTGACNNNGDAPTQDPVTFDSCCNGQGKCICQDLAGAGASGLGQNSCRANWLCAPEGAVDNGSLPTCTSDIVIFPNVAGVCMGDCVPQGNGVNNLNMGTCANSTDLCVPCNRPDNGMDTHACD